MSSPRLSLITRTTVFQLVLYASGAFVLISLAIIWGLGAAWMWQQDRALLAQIDSDIVYAEEVYYRRGTEALAEEIRWDDQLLWGDDVIFEVLEGQGELIVLRADTFDPIAGFDGLYADNEGGPQWIDHPDISDQVLSRIVELRGGETVTVGRFIPPSRAEMPALLAFASIALVGIVLPLSLVTGYFLARKVVRRMQAIAQTTEDVAAGAMTSRAPLSGAGDEFDRLAQGINLMLDRVEQLNRNIEAVSVGVAHDLKTPLANIGGRLELIRRDLADPARVAEHVDVAEARVADLLGTFNAMLRLGEVEAGQRQAGFAAVDLSALVSGMGETYAPLFEDADKRLTVEVAEGISLQGDAALLQQMVSNLLENALQHARDGADCQLRLTDGPVIIMADDGPGIAPQLVEQVFERFVRGDASRGSAGNGLGLSLVQAIATLHGAKVQVRPGTPGAELEVIF